MNLFFAIDKAATTLEVVAKVHSDPEQLKVTMIAVAADLKIVMAELAPAWGGLSAAIKELEKVGKASK